jgi:hypothetical protein
VTCPREGTTEAVPCSGGRSTFAGAADKWKSVKTDLGKIFWSIRVYEGVRHVVGKYQRFQISSKQPRWSPLVRQIDVREMSNLLEKTAVQITSTAINFGLF